MKAIGVDEGRQNINSIGMFDLGKGILMSFVVFGHSFTLFVKYWEIEKNSFFLTVLLTFAGVLIYGLIPMFFLMSGYGFRKQKMLRCFVDRVRYLLKPYIWVACIVAALTVLKAVVQKKSVLDALMYQGFPFLLGLCPGETQVLGKCTASIGPMWFLVALGISWMVLNLVFQLKDEVLRVLCLMTLAAFCTRLSFHAFMPFCIAQSLCCAGYLYMGYYVKKNRLLTKKLSWKSYGVLIAISVVAFLFGTVDVSQNVWKLGFFDYIASGIAAFLLCKFFMYLERYNGRIANMFRMLGRNSLYIFCIHTIEYLVFPWEYIASLFDAYAWIGIMVVSVIRILIIGVGCILIHSVVKRLRNVRRR